MCWEDVHWRQEEVAPSYGVVEPSNSGAYAPQPPPGYFPMQQQQQQQHHHHRWQQQQDSGGSAPPAASVGGAAGHPALPVGAGARASPSSLVAPTSYGSARPDASVGGAAGHPALPVGVGARASPSSLVAPTSGGSALAAASAKGTAGQHAPQRRVFGVSAGGVVSGGTGRDGTERAERAEVGGRSMLEPAGRHMLEPGELTQQERRAWWVKQSSTRKHQCTLPNPPTRLWHHPRCIKRSRRKRDPGLRRSSGLDGSDGTGSEGD
eukprot:g15787.t1